MINSTDAIRLSPSNTGGHQARCSSRLEDPMTRGEVNTTEVELRVSVYFQHNTKVSYHVISIGLKQLPVYVLLLPNELITSFPFGKHIYGETH